ncbi:MAG: glycosyltransferase family 2 protein [Nitrospirae bacterium]|nr:glycosyltransferase family 2 protein [Nitrospirota bacterium]
MKAFEGKISVIMPAHNEGSHIYSNLRETERVFREAGADFEIVLVDDGSGDDTYDQAVRAAKEIPELRVERYDVNSGKGNAIKAGWSLAAGDAVVFLDADLDLHPAQLNTLFRIMREQDADVVIGSKRHPESKIEYPLRRRIISDVYAAVLWVLFGLPLKDTQSGIKLYKKRVLDAVFPYVECKRYAFDVELLAHAHAAGYKIVESPIVLNFRRERRWGRIGLKTLVRTGIDTLAVFYRVRFTRRYRANT